MLGGTSVRSPDRSLLARFGMVPESSQSQGVSYHSQPFNNNTTQQKQQRRECKEQSSMRNRLKWTNPNNNLNHNHLLRRFPSRMTLLFIWWKRIIIIFLSCWVQSAEASYWSGWSGWCGWRGWCGCRCRAAPRCAPRGRRGRWPRAPDARNNKHHIRRSKRIQTTRRD